MLINPQMRLFSLLLLTVFLSGIRSFTACAQSGGTLKGSIEDTSGMVIGFANIALLRDTDSAVARVTTAGEDGHFILDAVPAGRYRMVVTVVGFERYTSPVITVSGESDAASLGTIRLFPAAGTRLREVTVRGNKPFISHEIDRTIVNVDALLSNAGANAMEVLERTPGIVVNNGVISLKGKTGVVIFMNDKPVYLSETDLANYLKSLPAEQLDKIEIMSNPPAKYDAAGNAGVINIRTKRDRARGFSGSVTANMGQGIYWRAGANANLYYNTGKVLMSAHLSHTKRTDYRRLEIGREFRKSDGGLEGFFEQVSVTKAPLTTTRVKYGLDYLLSDRTTVGFSVEGGYNPFQAGSNNTSLISGPDHLTDSAVYAFNNSESRFRNGALDIFLRHLFDSTGKELSVNLDLARYRSTDDRTFVNNTYLPSGEQISEEGLMAALPSDIDIYAAKADYTHPLTGGGKFEAGLKSSYVSTDSRALYYLVTKDSLVPDWGRTNSFLYKENIHAAYVNLRKAFSRFEMQLGLRVENTVVRGHQLGNEMVADSSFKKNYTNLFPTAYLSCRLDSAGNNSLTLSYGKRVDRPYYEKLNPFLFYNDKFTAFAGNPYLNPQYAHNLELSYNHKDRLTTSFVYSITNGLMDEMVSRDGNVLISSTGNIGRNRIAGITVSSSLNPAKWWDVNIYAEGMNGRVQGTFSGGYLDTAAYYGELSVNNKFRMGRGWNAELICIYVSQRVSGQFISNDLWQVNTGVQKNFWRDKIAVKLTMRDIFYSTIFAGRINTIRMAAASYKNKLDTRTLNLSITYRFGKAGSPKRSDKESGASNEQQRVTNK